MRRVVVLKGVKRSLRVEAPKGAKRSLRVEVARPPLLPPVAKKAEVELVQAKAQKGEFLSVSGQNTISLLSHGSHCHSIVSGSEESGSDDDASESSS